MTPIPTEMHETPRLTCNYHLAILTCVVVLIRLIETEKLGKYT